MDDERVDVAGAGLPADPGAEPIRPVTGEQWTGPSPAVGVAPLQADAEHYWQGLLAQLEAEADQIPDKRRRIRKR
jgi:hypothetical protein